MFELSDPLWDSTLYFLIWEILAIVFILTNFYLIWRVSVLTDKINDLIVQEEQ